MTLAVYFVNLISVTTTEINGNVYGYFSILTLVKRIKFTYKNKCILCCVFTHKHTEVWLQTDKQHFQNISKISQKTSVNKCNKQNAMNRNKQIFIPSLIETYRNTELFVHDSFLPWMWHFTAFAKNKLKL